MITTQKQPLPLLTVLMPVYNAEKFLDESIGSILNQTYLEFELLILDDASTDNSLKIIKNYAKEDKRIKVLINKTNQKQAKCRNRLLKNTTTEFVAWMDADDISLGDRLQIQMDFLKQNPDIDAVSNQYNTFGDHGTQLQNFTSKFSLLDIEIKTNFIFGYDFFLPSSLMKMKKIKEHNIFFRNNYKLTTGEDHQYIIDCFPFMKFANLNKVLYKYRQHHKQTMAINQQQMFDNAAIIFNEHLLKFNIKADLNIIKIFLDWYEEKFDYQKFKKAVKVLEQIYLIKNFYGYTSIDRLKILLYYTDLLKYLCQNSFITNDQKIVKEFFKTIVSRYPNDKPYIFNTIYSRYLKTNYKGKLFLIKTFGFINELKPLLTVLMPVYNAEKFLDESIGSILNQTYLEFELLILDDASTDNSLKIIKNYAKEDKRIKVLINKTNQKQAKCRNRLLKNTTTEFIAWMDADDISLGDRLQIQMDFLKQNPDIDAVSNQYNTFGGHGTQLQNFTSKFSLLDIEIKTNFIFGYDFLFGCSLMKMKKIKEHNIFFRNNYKLTTGEDHQYIIDCFPFMKFANLNKVLYKYRQDFSQTTTINQQQIFNNAAIIFNEHLLKFNIKTDLNIIKIFLTWYKEKFDYQKFKKAVKVLEQIYLIKDFYGHTGVDRSKIFIRYTKLLKYLWQNSFITNDQKIVKEFFKVILQKYPSAKPFIFNEIYYSYLKSGHRGKLFFIKTFGFINELKPLLTVLMPVYNAEKFLDESIGSILNQTYLEFELLILDDASTDNSLKIIKNYAKEDKRIKVLINKTNQKQAKCRNRLLKNTTTEFIAWMDADDISLGDRLQIQMDFLKQNPDIDAVSNQYNTFGDHGTQLQNFTSKFSLLDIEIKTNFLFGYDFLFGCSLMKMKKIKEHNIFFRNNYKLTTGEDHQYIIDCFPFMKFANLNKVLYKYRQDFSQTTTINQQQIFNNATIIFNEHLLKFNIKADLNIIKIFLNWYEEKFDYQKFKKAVKVLEQIYLIKDFYGYTSIDRSKILIYYIDLLQHLCQNSFITNDQKIVKEFLKLLLVDILMINHLFLMQFIVITSKLNIKANYFL